MRPPRLYGPSALRSVTFDTDRTAIRPDFHPVLHSAVLVLEEYNQTSNGTPSGRQQNRRVELRRVPLTA